MLKKMWKLQVCTIIKILDGSLKLVDPFASNDIKNTEEESEEPQEEEEGKEDAFEELKRQFNIRKIMS